MYPNINIELGRFLSIPQAVDMPDYQKIIYYQFLYDLENA
jgi:hypothetical protein